jgi:DNA-binding transcriptional regulator YiaG
VSSLTWLEIKYLDKVGRDYVTLVDGMRIDQNSAIQPGLSREAIQQMREQLKMSQAEFAAFIGIAQQTLSKFEQGKKKVSGEMARRIINAVDEAKRKKDVDATIVGMFVEVRQSMLAKTETASLPEAELNAQAARVTKEQVPTINKLVTELDYYKKMYHSQTQVIKVRGEQVSELEARVAKLEQELARERTKRTRTRIKKGEAANV